MTWHPDMPEEYKNQIVTGDARELAKRIPDESVDLIFTDPPYSDKFLPLYSWVAKIAKRILKPDGVCLVYAGILRLDKIMIQMAEHLNWWWMISLDEFGPTSRVFPRQVCNSWRPLLIYRKSNKPNLPKWINDKFSGVAPSKMFHKWGQEAGAPIRYIPAWMGSDGTLFEPFTGGGTTIAACKVLSRNYIAFEIDPDTAELARERVRNTQPPLFVMEPEQLEL